MRNQSIETRGTAIKTVEQEQDTRPVRALPPGVLDALGELAGAAKDGLLALSVGVGLGVLSEMMEAELDEVVGPKHAQNAERTAVCHGHADGEVTLGGRRVAVRRPRARAVDDEHEVPLQTYPYFAARPVDAGRVGTDAGWCQHASLRAYPRARR